MERVLVKWTRFQERSPIAPHARCLFSMYSPSVLCWFMLCHQNPLPKGKDLESYWGLMWYYIWYEDCRYLLCKCTYIHTLELHGFFLFCLGPLHEKNNIAAEIWMLWPVLLMAMSISHLPPRSDPPKNGFQRRWTDNPKRIDVHVIIHEVLRTFRSTYPLRRWCVRQCYVGLEGPSTK